MSGPHPAVAEVRRAVRASLTDVPVDTPVLVACSGGADSLALAAALAFVADRGGRRAGLVTVDHGLQSGSDQQARRVATIGYELGLEPVHLIVVEVDPANPGGPEAAARTARYRALDALAGQAILLGHTLDDQAETVLLGLGRGSGPRSIAGMRAISGHYRRPLLGIRRETTRQACAALGLDPWDDPQNNDPRYQRVRLRTEVLPLLEDVLQGGVAEALARTASLLQDDLDALDGIAAEHRTAADTDRTNAADTDCAGEPADRAGATRSTTPPALDVAELTALAPAIRRRVLREWAHAFGVRPGELSAKQLTALDALVTHWHGQGPIQLPGGFAVHRSSGTLSLRLTTAATTAPTRAATTTPTTPHAREG